MTEQLVRVLFDRLNADSRSPVAGKLSAHKSIKSRISRVTFNRAISSALNTGVLRDTDTEESRYLLILNYLNAFDAELPERQKDTLLRSAFFEAIFEVMDEVVRTSIAKFKNAKSDSLRTVVRPLARFTYTGTTGKALPTKKSIVQTMQTILRHSITLTESML